MKNIWKGYGNIKEYDEHNIVVKYKNGESTWWKGKIFIAFIVILIISAMAGGV